jgi:hypothetical protein
MNNFRENMTINVRRSLYYQFMQFYSEIGFVIAYIFFLCIRKEKQSDIHIVEYFDSATAILF